MESNLCQLTALELAQQIREKRVSSREAVTALFERIERLQPRLNAYISLDEDAALARAGAIDDAIARGENPGRLAGVPIAIKDNICTTDFRTTCASKILESFIPPYDAHVVECLRHEGAVIVGKTNLDEFAMGATTENSAFNPTRNPWNPDRVPGGSSGGSAAAISADMAFLALGSDTGGSVRQPAAFCGCVGLKPTYGRVSRYGLVAFASSLDQIGPIAKDVRDAALMLEIIGNHDRRDSTSVDRAGEPYLELAQRPLEKLRVGMPKEYFLEGLSPEIESAVRAALKTLEKLGAQIVDISLPRTDYAVSTYYVLAPAEASSNLARYDGVHYGRRSENAQDIISLFSRSRVEGFGAEVQRRILLGTYALSSGYYDAYYLKASRVRRMIREDFDRAFEQVDIIVGPTTPTEAFPLAAHSANPLELYLADIFTIPMNLIGGAGISVPCGFMKSGLPIGLQMMANSFDEARLLRLALAYERETAFRQLRRPELR